MPDRTATVRRTTGETDVSLTLNLDGTGRSAIGTGVGFFDHMLDLLAKHSLIDLDIKATGDLHVDAHHTVEDVGLALGAAILEAVGDKKGIRRYGWAIIPMDESLAQVAVDLSSRPAYVSRVHFRGPAIGTFPTELFDEFFKSVANAGKLNLHAAVPYGANDHHMAEAVFKAFAKSLRQAVELDPRNPGVPSTKGTLTC